MALPTPPRPPAAAEHQSGHRRCASQGPEPYLLLGANNAEMRNGSGMALSAAELKFDDGRMSLGDVRPTADLVVAGDSVPAPEQLAANWPWIDAEDLRNVGLTADFPQSAQLAVDTWAKVPGGSPVAGVILIDVDGIRSLLRVVGPVEVDGVRYTADTVRANCCASSTRSSTATGTAAATSSVPWRRPSSPGSRRASGSSMTSPPSSPTRCRAGTSWCGPPTRRWRRRGTRSAPTATSPTGPCRWACSTGSANKLDSWIDTDVDVTTQRITGGRRKLTVTYRITNRAPGSGPAYVVGPTPTAWRPATTPLAVVNLPAGPSDVNMTGAEVFLQGGDGPTVVVGGRVVVASGGRAPRSRSPPCPAGGRPGHARAVGPHPAHAVDGQRHRLRPGPTATVPRRVSLRPSRATPTERVDFGHMTA